ncbi:hypothetical protein CJF42_21670 [Pseudoalteromonas sp. NBT06-2]|uniref:TonB-dependent receptor domain-containing protein n=1 Tax=Pseudoalteromonas sp. NBT06-2 TaxID=2025950 RepID=UPI000BA7BF6B|nr:TonB-dependent receptor [Pseudoalteromonas sp. NBT06-2]PAJ72351.1 hypothetical protein CJF42_21670 [Pseudoalteromonas sp. NBT06-2]
MFNKSKTALAVFSAISLFSSSTTVAQNIQVEENIEHISVTANKIKQSIESVLATVNVITRADIEASNTRDLPSLLNTQAGIDVVRSGGFGQKADVFLRGATSKYLLVLVDGVRVGNAQSDSKELTNFPVNSIERIEIVKGARAAVYGSDALAGVINIITRNSDATTLEATFGSNSYKNIEATVGHNQDALSLNFNLGFEKTDGYDITEKRPDTDLSSKDFDNDAYENKNLGINVKYNAEDLGYFTFMTQYSEGYGGYDNAWGNDAYEFENYITQLGWSKTYDAFTHTLNLNKTQDKSVQVGTELEENFQTNRKEIEFRTTYNLNQDIIFNAGINWYNENVEKATQELKLDSRTNTALFLGSYYDDGDLIANMSLRTDDFEQYGAENTYNVSVGYSVAKPVTVRFSRGIAFRAPSFDDLYASTMWTQGNEELMPEEALNHELGIFVELSSGSFDVAVFRNEIDNMIQSNFDPDSGKYIPFNVNEARMKGFEINASFTFLEFDHSLNATLVDAIDINTNQDLVRRPGKTFNWSASKQWEDLNIQLEMQYRSDRPTITYYDDTISSFTLWNVSANYDLTDELKLTARVENLFDKEYASAAIDKDEAGELYYYKSPARQYFIGVDYRF